MIGSGKPTSQTRVLFTDLIPISPPRKQLSIAVLVPGRRGLLLSLSVPCGARAVATASSGGDNDGIHLTRAKSRVIGATTTVAWSTWINTNSKSSFDDRSSSSLEKY
jgi:hypothetical protein